MPFKFSAHLTLLLLLGVMCSAPLQALEPPLQQEMPVADRSSEERVKASIRGFFEVLSELSGGQLDVQSRRELAGEADSYLSGYRYVSRQQRLYLQLSFDREAVQQRLRQEQAAQQVTQQQPASDPPVLLWLSVRQGDLQALVTEGAQGLLPNTLRDVALAHGQSIWLPSDNALSAGELTMTQLLRGEAEPVMRASAGYGTEQVLMGALRLVDGDQWAANWQLAATGKQWRSQQGSLGQVLDQGLRGYKQLKVESAVIASARGYGLADDQVAVSVSGVRGMDDFIWLKQRVGELIGRDKVRAVMVGGEAVLFAVDAANDQQSVQRLLASENRLSLVPQAFGAGDGSQGADIHYMLY